MKLNRTWIFVTKKNHKTWTWNFVEQVLREGTWPLLSSMMPRLEHGSPCQGFKLSDSFDCTASEEVNILVIANLCLACWNYSFVCIVRRCQHFSDCQPFSACRRVDGVTQWRWPRESLSWLVERGWPGLKFFDKNLFWFYIKNIALFQKRQTVPRWCRDLHWQEVKCLKNAEEKHINIGV